MHAPPALYPPQVILSMQNTQITYDAAILIQAKAASIQLENSHAKCH